MSETNLVVDYDPFGGREIERVVPTTEAQREIWLAAQLSDEASLAYNESISVSFDGALDTGALARALAALALRHEALRATVGADGSDLYILRDIALVPATENLADLPAPAAADRLAALQRAAVATPFDLVEGPLVRATVVQVSDRRHVLILTCHHIVCDGWSFGVIARDLTALYAAALDGAAAAALPAADRFGDYALAQHDDAHVQAAEADLRYWVSLYDQSVPVLELPTDRPRPARRVFASAREDLLVDAATTQALRKLGAAQGASLFVTLFTFFAALLSRLGGESDVVVGVSAAGQAAEGMPKLVGHCVNLLPIRTQAPLDADIPSLIAATRTRVLDAYDHQSSTFGGILKRLQVARDPSRMPLVSVLFNLDSAIDDQSLSTPGLQASLRSNPRCAENFELYINASQIDGALLLECQYKSELFDAATVRRWLELYRTALARAGADGGLSAAQAFAPSDADTALLDGFNQTARHYDDGPRLADMIRRGCAAHADAVAVVFEGRSVSYRELEAQARRIAHRLRALGAGPGTLVGVCMERSVELVAALVGVVYSGAAYVPLDPTLPVERLAGMCADAALQIVVTRTAEQARTGSALPPGAQIILLDAADALPADAPLEFAGGADDPAYVIFTSGSTGRPKGAINAHRGIVNRLAWMQEAYGLQPADRVMQKTPFSFDVSVWEFFWPLTVGATLVVARPEGHRDGGYLVDLVRATGVTVMHFVPSMLRFFLDEPAVAGCATLRRVVCSGEALPPDLVQRFFARLPRVRLANLYGPTEAAVDVTAWECQPGDARGIVPIGAPIANTQMHVLDARLQALPVGVPGDLYIGGVQVGLGYVARPELTAERFIASPLPSGGRLYKTGDVARWTAQGVLEYLGRSDHQVKVRGYRIELGEIETRLTALPGIAAAAVVTREDEPGDVRIVAYVVTADGQAPDAEALRTGLRSGLPDYMVPQHVVGLPAIPLLTSGKVDRRALPAPAGMVGASAARERVEPRTALERQVLRAMEEILHFPGLGIRDDFFAIGGHSLLAARLTARLNGELELALPLRTLFESPTVEQLARAIELAQGTPSVRRAPIRHDPSRRSAPLTPMQDRIRFLEELHPGRVVYNSPSGHRLVGPLDAGLLERALRDVVRRQPALRTAIAPAAQGQGFVQETRDDVEVALPLVDLTALPRAEREGAMRERMQAIIDQPIDIHRAPLFRCALYKLDDQVHGLLFMPHHIVWDGWSFDLFYEEMAAAYGALVRGAANPLPPLVITYGDYAAWHAQWMQSPECAAQLRYWKDRFAAAPQARALTPDHPRTPGMSGEGATEWVRIDKQATERLRDVARQANVTLNMLAMAVYGLMLAQAAQSPTIVIGVPVRGRTMSETEPVMGFFNNLLPLQLEFDAAAGFLPFLGRVKNDLVAAFSHQDIPFERVAEEPEVATRAQRAGLYQALFSFQDARERTRQWGPLQQEAILLFQKGATEDLGLWLMEVPGGLEGGFTYNSDLFLRVTAVALRTRFLEMLDRLSAEPSTTLGALADDAESVAGQMLRRLGATASKAPAAATPAAPAIATPATPAPPSATVADAPTAPAPRPAHSPTELALIKIWATLLDIDEATISPQDNFFDLGGNSLLAMRAVEASGRTLGFRIDARRYFYETLAQLADARSLTVAADAAAKPAASGGLLRRLLGSLGRKDKA